MRRILEFISDSPEAQVALFMLAGFAVAGICFALPVSVTAHAMHVMHVLLGDGA